MNSFVYYISKSVNEPELIFPFIMKQIRKFVSFIISLGYSKVLDKQIDEIDYLRQEGDYLLIVLDACRYDYLDKVIDDYFPEAEVKPVFNEARNTFEWGRNVWGDQIWTVPYISGAVPINSMIDEETAKDNDLYQGYVPSNYLVNIVDVWDTGWDDELNVTPPEKVTEAGLDRENSSEMVVHYFQPHAPYIGDEKETGLDDVEPFSTKTEPADKIIWDKIKSGEISDDRLKRLYEDNLRRALESVTTLVSETSYDKVVITADHGEALGELGVYAHPEHLDHPKVRVVPWVDIS